MPYALGTCRAQPFAKEITMSSLLPVPPHRDHPAFDCHYWYSLVNEKVAAEFLHLSTRTMQGFRQKGDGPPYIVVSLRCVRYRRIDLLFWCDIHQRNSTSDTGVGAQEERCHLGGAT